MKTIAIAILALGVVASIPAAAQQAAEGYPAKRLHSHVARHRAQPGHVVDAHATAEASAAVATNPFAPPPLAWPRIAPYPDGAGDTDGLSTNADDCNKGCVGVAP